MATKNQTSTYRTLERKGTIEAVPVAGISFDGRQKVAHALASAVRDNRRAWVELRRERNNTHDANAIAVIAHTTKMHARVGYVPAKVAATLAPAMDAGTVVRPASFAFVGGYGGRNIGMRLDLDVFA